MATGNFYEAGSHGLNVITDEYDEAVGDTLANIVSELKDYSVDAIHTNMTPRSFDTGMVFAVFNNKNRVVAILEVCHGYYEAANINIHTRGDLLEEYDREDCTFNERDIQKVVKAVRLYTTQYNKVYQFSNGETGYAKV